MHFHAHICFCFLFHSFACEHYNWVNEWMWKWNDTARVQGVAIHNWLCVCAHCEAVTKCCVKFQLLFVWCKHNSSSNIKLLGKSVFFVCLYLLCFCTLHATIKLACSKSLIQCAYGKSARWIRMISMPINCLNVFIFLYLFAWQITPL